jgi:Tol biopolymer transport system component
MSAPDRWSRVEAIYHAARDRNVGERAIFLDAACKGDVELRREVESLLAQPSGGGLLSQPAVAVAAQMVTNAGATVLTGRRIGAYQLHGLLGAGGMGEVYRARDTKLGRDVAVKILPRLFTSDPERLARFEREARVLASLNHPHIGAIYGLEDADGLRALVLELVEGDTLADRIARGALPVKDTLAIARQIADALDAAHEKGIVHRDLKPANIKITPEGIVKVLDFGLAKASRDGAATDLTHSPTMTVGGTRDGIVLGTAAYMSPEQARGQAVDKRSDIWAFGCVLYEMLANDSPFAGATVSDTIAAILEREPDWTVLPESIPSSVHRLLRRSLQKDIKLRLRDIGDAWIELDSLSQTDGRPETVSARVRPGRLWLLGLALMAVSALAAIGIQRLFFDIGGSTAKPSRPAMALARATADDGITANPALSSDGALLAYASDRAGMDNLDVWVQQTAGSAPLQLTHDAVDEFEPAFSPDGSRLAYRSERDGGGIYIVPALGGQEPRLLVPGGRRPRFSPDGRLIAYWTGSNVGFYGSSGGYRTFVIPASGGASREIGGFTGARYPVWSPDGQSLLLLGSRDPRPLATAYDWWRAPIDGAAPTPLRAKELLGRAGIAFDSGNVAPDDWRGDRVLLSDSSYLWSVRLDSGATTASGVDRLTFGTNHDVQATTAASGLIAFSSASLSNSVWTLPIDPDRGVVTGAPRRLSAGAGLDARPSATRDGQLVAYRTSTPRPSILIRNLKTQSIIDVGVAGSGFGPAISPDGTYVAYEDGGGVQVISTRGGTPRALCKPCQIGDWSADSQAVVVVKGENNAGRLTLIRLSDGVMRDLIVSPDRTVNRPFPSPDGRLLVFRRGSEGDEIMVAPLGTGQPVPPRDWIQLVAPERDARPCGWSPDGSLVYFVSGRDGIRCLYAQRVNRTTGAPVGEPFVVRHFHGGRSGFISGFNVLSTGPANAIAGGVFFYDMSAWSANIWTMSAK